MENEHTNNCGEFRAVKEMPLPYNIQNSNDDDDDFSHDTINNIPSNLQNFVKKLNKNKDSKNFDDDDNSNNSNNNNNIDITDMKEFDVNNKGQGNIKNMKLNRSHSQEINFNSNDNENDMYNISNVKLWNIKPSDAIKNNCFDFQDPYNSNKTIHAYSIGSEFNVYISKMKENLSSIDTIIKRYDTKQDICPLSIKIENFNDNKTSDLLNLYQQKFNTNTSPHKKEDSSKSKEGGETIRIDSEEDSDITNNKGLTNIFNHPKTISNTNYTEISSSSITTNTNSETLTIY